MKTFETKKVTVEVNDNLTGKILDIGGGGEGIIGRAFEENVTAIDRRQDELDEAPCNCEKILMDAADLQFDNCTFDTATSFFTMMYIDKDEHKKVFKEVYRVLKPGGKIIIWDAVIPENKANYEVFIIHLKVKLPNETIQTGYGVSYNKQNALYYTDLLNDVGFKIESSQIYDDTFKIVAVKEN